MSVPFHDPVTGEFLGTVESYVTANCPHARRITAGGCSEGCCDDYRCLDCGIVFRVEVPK